MSTTAPTTYANARLQDVIAGDAGWPLRLWRAFLFIIKAIIGALFCQGMYGAFGALNFLGSIVVIGWTYRLMQRHALKVWWKNSQPWNEGMRFQTFVTTEDTFRDHLFWPNFFLRQNFLQHLRSGEFKKRSVLARISYFVGSLFASLGRNLTIGIKAIFNTWVITAIPIILLQVAWFQGWDNSFNKGYEQAAIGPVTFFSGVILFTATMFYIPIAQARQAVTGDWRTFFHYKTVRQVIRRRWFSCFVLAGGYALLCLPVFAAKAAVYGMGNQAHIAELLPLQQWEILNGYLFQTSLLLLLPAFVFVRILAAEIYASAMREIVKVGDSALVKLSEFESEAFRTLEISERPKAERSLPTRFILWTSSLSGRLITGGLSFLLWFTVAFQPAVQQFFNFRSKGYLNHPLVQMPYFHFVPKALTEAAGK